jgi:hypothetical protein
MPGPRDIMKRAAKLMASFISLVTGSSLLASETTLQTTTVPKNVLTEAGDYVEITLWGTVVNNANAKTVKLYWGATVVLSIALTAAQAGFFRIRARVYRTGLSTQRSWVELIEGTAALAAAKVAFAFNTALAESEQADITVKVTGTAPTADNDMTVQGMTLEPGNITRETQL